MLRILSKVNDTGKAPLTIGQGSAMLCVRWLIMLPVFYTVMFSYYGVVAAIIFSIFILLVFTSVSILLKRAHGECNFRQSVLESFLSQKTSHTAYKASVFLVFACEFFMLILLQTIVNAVFLAAFPYSAVMTAAIGFLCVIPFYFRGGRGRAVFTQAIVFAGLGASMLVPLYAFLMSGVIRIYWETRLFHPFMLFFQHPKTVTAPVIAAIVFLGMLLTDPATWEIANDTAARKRKKTIVIAGVLFTAFAFSFISFVLLGVFEGNIMDSAMHDRVMLARIASPGTLNTVFTVFIITLTCTAYIYMLRAFVDLLRAVFPQSAFAQKNDLILYAFLVISMTLILTAVNPDFEGLVFVAVCFFVSVAPLFTVMILKKGKAGLYLPLCCVAGFAAGSVSAFMIADTLLSLAFAFLISSAAAFPYLLYRRS